MSRDWVDGARAAVALYAVGAVLLLVVPRVETLWWPDPPPPSTAAGLAVLALACAGELLRRARPLLGLAVVGLAVAVGVLVVGRSHLGVLLVLGDLLYCAVLHSGRRASTAVCAVAAGVLALVGLSLLVSTGPEAAVLGVLSLSALVVPVLWAREVRHHRDVADAERGRAEQARRLAELDRVAVVSAERARTARDLHDVIAGQLSAIAIRSEAALTVPGADEGLLRGVLADVRRDSVASLAEMRTMIGLLRADGAPPELAAPAGLADLGPLLDAARASGLVVHLDDRRGDAPAPPAAVDLAAHRIVQESLTNAAKHAPGSTVRIGLECRDATLIVTADSDLVPGARPAGGTGTGLLGLRERAGAVGGRLVAGPDGDRWRVRAELPVPVAVP